MKRKERTPEQIRRRFRFATSLLLFFAVFPFILSLMTKADKTGESEAPEYDTSAYDIQLDSMVCAMFGDTVSVVWKGEFVQVPFDDSLIPEVEEYERAAIRLDLYRSDPTGEHTEKKELELENKVAEAKTLAAEARERYRSRSMCTARPVKMESEHCRFSCFQSYSETDGLSSIDGLLKTPKKTIK